MRILYICADHGIPLYGRRGCSTHVRETCRGLQAAGHEVVLLMSQMGDADGFEQDLEVIQVDPPRSKKMGYDLRNLWHNLAVYRAAKRIAKDRKIDAVYERLSLYSLAGDWIGARLKLPRIVEINAFLSVEHRDKIHFPRLARAVERRIAHRAPALIVVSPPLADMLKTMDVADERIVDMPIAVDVSLFRPNAEAGRAAREKWGLGERFVVGYVGGLAEWHGISMLYDIARGVRETRQDFVLFVVGGKSHEVEEHRRKVQEAGLGEHLIFAGSVPYLDVPSTINAMDTALVPDTLEWTCPTKMFEYQASGIPTIAPKYPAILGAMDHGGEGLLFKPRDIGGIVKAIGTLADDRDACQTMGEKARERVIGTHSWECNIRGILDLYEKMQSGTLPLSGLVPPTS